MRWAAPLLRIDFIQSDIFITYSAAVAVGSSHFTRDTRCMKNVVLIRIEREKQKSNVVRCICATWIAFVSLPIRYPGCIELIVIKILHILCVFFLIHFIRSIRGTSPVTTLYGKKPDNTPSNSPAIWCWIDRDGIHRARRQWAQCDCLLFHSLTESQFVNEDEGMIWMC